MTHSNIVSDAWLQAEEQARLLPLAEQRLHALRSGIRQVQGRAPQARRSSCCSASCCGEGCDAERYHAPIAEEAPYVKASECSAKALHLQLALAAPAMLAYVICSSGLTQQPEYNTADTTQYCKAALPAVYRHTVHLKSMSGPEAAMQ